MGVNCCRQTHLAWPNIGMISAAAVGHEKNISEQKCLSPFPALLDKNLGVHFLDMKFHTGVMLEAPACQYFINTLGTYTYNCFCIC